MPHFEELFAQVGQSLDPGASVVFDELSVSSFLSVGDLGDEDDGIDINGTTYDAEFKVSHLGDTRPALIHMHQHSTGTGVATAPTLISSRSNSAGEEHGTVVANQHLLSLVASGWTADHYDIGGRIDFKVDNTGTISGTSLPTRIELSVAQDGSTSPTPVLSLGSDLLAEFAGAVTVATTLGVTGLSTLPSLNSADGLQATKTANTSITPQWQMNGLTAANSAQGWNRWSNDTGAPNTIFSKSRGTAIGTHTIVQDGDLLARIGFTGSDGVAFFEGARIAAQVDGTPAVGSVPGQLILYTTTAGLGAATPTLTLRADKTAEFAGAATVAGTLGVTGLFSPTTMGAGGALQVFPDTTPNIQITGTTEAQVTFGISRFNAAPGAEPTIVMGHSRGTTVGSFTIVQADDTLASLTACGADGSAFAEAARIDFYVDGTPGAGDMPGRIVFSTSPDGSATPATVLTLKADKTALFTGNVNATTTLVVGNSAAIPANTTALIDRIGAGTLPALSGGTALTLQGNNAASNNVYLQLVAGTSGTAGVRFGDSGAAAQGRIDYDNSTDSFDIRTAGTSRMTITATAVTLAGLIAGSNITNTFTPTLTGVTNVSSSTAFLSGWVRIGNAVFFFTRISVTATAAGATTQIDISLPIASNFTAVNQCVGTGSILDSSTEVATVGVQADTTNDRASAVFVSTSTSARVYTLMIGYFVL
jgi:hypothetical protein